MSPAEIERLKQNFPAIYGGAVLDCSDDWLPLLLAFGGRLDTRMQAEMAFTGEGGAEELPCAVERVRDEGSGLKISLCPSLNMHSVVELREEFENLSLDFRESLQAQNPYLWTHNKSEQTSAEEALRADASPHSIQEMQRATVARARRDGESEVRV